MVITLLLVHVCKYCDCLILVKVSSLMGLCFHNDDGTCGLGESGMNRCDDVFCHSGSNTGLFND